MMTLTIADIRALRPCYDPSQYIAEDWTGTILDILDMEDAPAQDRLWVALRRDVLSGSVLQSIAFAMIRETPLADGRVVADLLTDRRSLDVLDIAERYARGDATAEELHAAAYAAAFAAARTAQIGIARRIIVEEVKS